MRESKKIPPIEEWITFRQAAELLKCRTSTVYDLRDKGKQSIHGAIWKLRAWKTAKGWVTTRREIERMSYGIAGTDEFGAED